MSDIFIPTLEQAMANDLSATFATDMPRIAVIDGKEYTVLTGDALMSENEAYGGQELVDLLEIHFQAKDLPAIAAETVMTVFSRDHKTSKVKIVLTSKLSDDENELIVTVRAA